MPLSSSDDDYSADDDDSSSGGSLQNVARKRQWDEDQEEEEDRKLSSKRARSMRDQAAFSHYNEPEGNTLNGFLIEEDIVEHAGVASITEDDSKHSAKKTIRSGRSCGDCETCTNRFTCGQCARCIVQMRCAFSPCFNYAFKDSTLLLYRNNAKLVKDANVLFENQYEKVYGENGAITIKLQNYGVSPTGQPTVPAAASTATEHTVSRKLCGSCSSCLDPVICGKCCSCRGTRSGRCAFLPCLSYKYSQLTLNAFMGEAKSVKKGDKRWEDKFEELYGHDGRLATRFTIVGKSHSVVHLRKGQRIGGRCGSCSTCVKPAKCGKCFTCRDPRKGKCIFALCLAYEYSMATLIDYEREAKAIKVADERFEGQYEHLFGPEGVFTSKLNKKGVSSRGNRGRSRCGTCLSCKSTLSCKKCHACRINRSGRCVFTPCLNFDYKESTLNNYRQEANSAKRGDEQLEIQFEKIYGAQGLFMTRNEKIMHTSGSPQGQRTAVAARRSGPFSCGDCSSCRRLLSCQICQRCKVGRRCVFDICQKFAYKYKDSMMSTYETWARQVLEICGDSRLEVRFEELFNKSASAIPLGTRIRGRWHKNNVCALSDGTKEALLPKEVICSTFCLTTETSAKAFQERTLKFVRARIKERLDLSQEVDDDRSILEVTRQLPQQQHIGADDKTQRHFLLDKGYHHHWINRNGCAKFAFGRIASCALIDGEPKFTVNLDLSVGHLLAYGIRNEAPKSLLCHVEEADAWAGYISFLAQTEGKKFTWPNCREYCPLESKPFHRQYTLPTLHSPAQHKSIDLIVKGHRLRLRAKESRIPNGGLGLFASAAPIAMLDSCHRSRNKALVLEEGELIDLGVYAPMRPEDLQPEHVHIVKNFIYNWKSEKWSFGSNADDGLVFDITDDGTGELSDLAENNILVYVNETNGTEVPTVFAREDPEGAVHYYLGHSTSGSGRLLIPTDGSELELKVDYGHRYESVRVRNGYSRLSGIRLQEEKEKASTYEKDMLNELNTITAEEVFDTQLFLEKLNSTWTEAATDNGAGANGRALLVTLVLFRRAMVIINEERNDSIHLDLVRSLRDLSLQFFDRFNYATNRSLILDNEWYSELLSTTLGLRVIKSIGDNTHAIRKAIQSLI